MQFSINRMKKKILLNRNYNIKILLLGEKAHLLNLNMPSLTVFFIHKGFSSLSQLPSVVFYSHSSCPPSLYISFSSPQAPGCIVLRDWNHTGDLEVGGLEEALLSLVAIPFCRPDPKIKVQNCPRIKETIHHTG